ncbi:alpha-glucosidase/alpha-galactosidase [Kiritimatiellaeota bacterium B1221]|nr:alpha-glucosidase/alpha-galactosidase [Kiritimatiellaeota bacterium B1221]
MSKTTPSNPSRPSVKIAYIGGGSRNWARDLMKDLASQAGFDGEIVLYDIDHPASLKNVEIGNQIFRRPEAVSSFKVRAVKTLKACLSQADFVVISIEPGPTENRFADLEIPKKYGIVQPVGDSTGPGGWLRALRSIPVFEGFAHGIMKYCPEAWVINYTNPMTLCTATLYAAEPDIQAFGCCHEVFSTQEKLRKMAEEAFGFEEVKRSEIKVNVNGVNHFTWVTEASCRGEDLMPLVHRQAHDPSFYKDATSIAKSRTRKGEIYASEGMVSMDLYRRFGALGAAGERHLVEFVPWYARNMKTLNQWGVLCTPYSLRLERSQKKDVNQNEYGQKELNPSGEEGVQQMEAILGLRELDTNVNLPNLGQSPDLPLESVVETNAAFRRGKVTPLMAKALPAGAASLVERIISVQEMTLEAAMNRDLDAATAALLCDPLMNISTDKAVEMAHEMIQHIGPELKGMGYKI